MQGGQARCGNEWLHVTLRPARRARVREGDVLSALAHAHIRPAGDAHNPTRLGRPGCRCVGWEGALHHEHDAPRA
jgi:hypothetical protein